MNYKKLIAFVKEKLTEMSFKDFTIETDINDDNDSVLIIPVYIDNIPEPDFDISVLISENGNVFFECELTDEVQESKRMAVLETLNYLNFKYGISLALDENDVIYLKYVCVICENEIIACKQVFTMLEFFINMIENCIDDIMNIIWS